MGVIPTGESQVALMLPFKIDSVVFNMCLFNYTDLLMFPPLADNNFYILFFLIVPDNRDSTPNLKEDVSVLALKMLAEVNS